MSADNKLRRFSFKLLHRIPVNEMINVFFYFAKVQIPSNTHSLACSVAEYFYYEMMTWFNNEQKSQFNMTKKQILFNDFALPIGSQHLLKWIFGIFITLMQNYIYDCKMMEKFPRGNQFKEKLNYQWKIENSRN